MDRGNSDSYEKGEQLGLSEISLELFAMKLFIEVCYESATYDFVKGAIDGILEKNISRGADGI
jgi:hypothetical protein